MTDHTSQKLTPREMVRAHAYPVLAGISTVTLVVIATSLAMEQTSFNSCINGMKRLSGYNRQDQHAMAVRSCNGG